MSESTDSARILDAIRRLVRHLRLADRAAQGELGISGAQLFVLVELGKTGSLSLNDLAARTRTDQSSVSVVVSRLVDAGLVTRERDARDARRLVLNLTKNGRALLVGQLRVVRVGEGMSTAELVGDLRTPIHVGDKVHRVLKDKPPAKDPSPEPIEGLVKGIDKDMVSVNIGSDAGLVKGQVLYVFRSPTAKDATAKYLGKIKIEEVKTTEAVARLESDFQTLPRAGDHVASKIGDK